jgi:hypothetical protein
MNHEAVLGPPQEAVEDEHSEPKWGSFQNLKRRQARRFNPIVPCLLEAGCIHGLFVRHDGQEP